MIALYVKEIKQYFRSMIGYVFLTIMTLICGFLFTTGNLMSQNGDIKIFFGSLFNVLIFLVPMLTMRQFSEEEKLKTRQLLFTLPLTLESIVLGKFLATLSMICIGLVMTLVYPVILASLGVFSPMVILGNYLAVILLVSAVISIGLFVSSLTENQVISGVGSYGILLILWLIDSLAPTISNPLLKKTVLLFSLKNNYIEFTYGIFNPAGVLYFISMTTLFLILTVVKLDGRRQ